MDSHVWLTLFLAALINAAIPGPILLLVMARAAGGGLRSGLRTALGGALAVALLLAAVWALLFGAWQLGSGLVSALKITGIGVLTILGLRMLRAIPSPGAPLPTRAAASDLGAGLAIGLFSPFNLVFFLVLLPQFATPATMTPVGIALASALVLLGSVLPLGAAAAVGAGQGRLSLGGRAGWSAAAA
jgi:threonine/homoserine/homoserine lactone efflux protein